MNEDSYPKMTELDCMVSPEPLQITKAMIPYAAPRGQRILSVFAKTLELRNTLRAFQYQSPDVSICSASEPTDMLTGIRRYCSPATRQRMDECINLVSILQMAEVLQEDGENLEGGE